MEIVVVGLVQHVHHSRDLGNDALLSGKLVEQVLEEGGTVLGIAALLLGGVRLELDAEVVREEVLGGEHPCLGRPLVTLGACLSGASHQVLLVFKYELGNIFARYVQWCKQHANGRIYFVTVNHMHLVCKSTSKLS